MDGDLLLEHLEHAAFGAFEVEQRAFLVQGLAVGLGNVRGILDAVHRVAHVLARRQAAVLLFGQQTLNRRVENRVLGVHGPDLVLQRLLAALLGRLIHPAMDPRPPSCSLGPLCNAVALTWASSHWFLLARSMISLISWSYLLAVRHLRGGLGAWGFGDCLAGGQGTQQQRDCRRCFRRAQRLGS